MIETKQSESLVEASDAPMVSVLISCFNAEDFIADAVASILAQTLTDWELVVVDDGSTDATLSQLDQFSDTRIRVVRSHENMGISRALNIGLQFVHGRYIARLDADDLASACRLEKQVDYLEKNPRAVAVGGSLSVFGETSESILARKPSDSLGPYFLRGNQYLSSSVMFRRECLQGRDIRFNETLPNAQDYDFWMQLSKYGNLAQVPGVLGQYRFHDSQETSRNALRQRRLGLRVQSAAVMGRYDTLGVTWFDRLMGIVFLARHVGGYVRIKFSMKWVN